MPGRDTASTRPSRSQLGRSRSRDRREPRTYVATPYARPPRDVAFCGSSASASVVLGLSDDWMARATRAFGVFAPEGCFAMSRTASLRRREAGGHRICLGAVHPTGAGTRRVLRVRRPRHGGALMNHTGTDRVVRGVSKKSAARSL